MLLHFHCKKISNSDLAFQLQFVAEVSDGIEQATETLTDPISGRPSHAKTVSGMVRLHDDDLFCLGDQKLYQHAITSIQKDFQNGLEDANGAVFVGQRVCWKTEGSAYFIQVDQERAIE